MVKSKGTAKNSAVKKTTVVDSVKDLPDLLKENAQKEEEIVSVPPDNYLFVSIGSISNIRQQLLSRDSCLKFRIQFGDGFVSDSPLISFSDQDGGETEVNWQAEVPCFTNRTQDLDYLTSTPVLVSIAEENQIIEHQEESESLEDPRKSVEFSPFAFCTLDLFPLILGESEICQTLLLEIVRKPKTANKSAIKDTKAAPTKEKTPKSAKSSDKEHKRKPTKSATSKGKGSTKNEMESRAIETLEESHDNEASFGCESPSVTQLPRISVQARPQLPILPKREFGDKSNVVFLTIESIYNVPEDFDGDSMDVQAGTLIPNEFDNEQVVHFGRGLFTRESDKVRTKRWINIDHFSGKSSHTLYTISEDLFPVRNKLGVDLCQVMSSDAPRIEWNRVKRSWLSSSGGEYLGEYLTNTKTWVVEVLITPKGGEKKKSVKSKGDLQPATSESMHLMAFFDVGAFTYPGMHGVRVASQLFTYCKADVEAKCGLRSRTVLTPPEQTKDGDDKANGKARSKADIKGKKAKGKAQVKGSKKESKQSKKESKQSKKESKQSKKESVSVKSSVHVAGAEEPKVDAVCESRPWFNEKGEPVFVIFELELMKPLMESITTEELFAKVDALIPVRPVVPEKVIAAKKAGEQFDDLINKIAKKLSYKYHNFIGHRNKLNLPMNAGDQNTKDFYQYLKETDEIAKIKTTLAQSVGVLIKDKFGYDLTTQDEQDLKAKHKFVSELYTRLFEKVNTIINTLPPGSDEQARLFKVPHAQMKRLDFESRKLGFSTVQEEMYLQQRSDTDVGTLFVQSSQCRDLDSAMELTLDLLTVDRNCREGLLLYATLLALKGDTQKAELVFQVTVAKHPEYMIAGYVLSLFYQMMDNKTAAEIVWQRTRRYTAKSQGRDDGALSTLYPELLDWDANMYEPKSVHLKCVELFLYVRIMDLDFVYLALSNELEKNGPSEQYFYYLAICRFRNRDYQEACDILRAISMDKPRLHHIRRLLGHCQYEMGQREAAVDNYRFVVETSESGVANHLVHLRLGDSYLELEDYPAAKAMFFESCRWTPTATSWLGVGIACYMQGDFAESERALTEANYLDRTAALVWGYLALVNLQLCRRDKFEQCYCRAQRFNMKDDKVMGMIRDLVQACGFPIPKLIHFDGKAYSF